MLLNLKKESLEKSFNLLKKLKSKNSISEENHNKLQHSWFNTWDTLWIS